MRRLITLDEADLRRLLLGESVRLEITDQGGLAVAIALDSKKLSCSAVLFFTRMLAPEQPAHDRPRISEALGQLAQGAGLVIVPLHEADLRRLLLGESVPLEITEQGGLAVAIAIDGGKLSCSAGLFFTRMLAPEQPAEKAGK